MAPKSYMAYCADKEAAGDDEARKVASKGVSKLHNRYSYDNYKSAMYDDKIFDAVNYSIKEYLGQMRTMKFKKRGLSGVQVKNLVLEDRVSIVPHKKTSCQSLVNQ